MPKRYLLVLLPTMRTRPASTFFRRASSAPSRAHDRHVFDPAPVVDRGRRDPELVPVQAVLVEDLRDALDLELLDVGLDPALGEDLDGSLERVDLRDVDRGEAAAEDDRAVVELVLRVGHVAALGVVERNHEGFW